MIPRVCFTTPSRSSLPAWPAFQALRRRRLLFLCCLPLCRKGSAGRRKSIDNGNRALCCASPDAFAVPSVILPRWGFAGPEGLFLRGDGRAPGGLFRGRASEGEEGFAGRSGGKGWGMVIFAKKFRPKMKEVREELPKRGIMCRTGRFLVKNAERGRRKRQKSPARGGGAGNGLFKPPKRDIM